MERREYRFVVIDAQTCETFAVTVRRGLADFWRVALLRDQRPIAETTLRLRDNAALAWLIETIKTHSAPSS